jgi:hypothetical protein
MAETFILSGRLVSVSDDNVVSTAGRMVTNQERRIALVLSGLVRRGTHRVTDSVVTQRPVAEWPNRARAVADPAKRARVLAERAAARAREAANGIR